MGPGGIRAKQKQKRFWFRFPLSNAAGGEDFAEIDQIMDISPNRL